MLSSQIPNLRRGSGIEPWKLTPAGIYFKSESFVEIRERSVPERLNKIKHSIAATDTTKLPRTEIYGPTNLIKPPDLRTPRHPLKSPFRTCKRLWAHFAFHRSQIPATKRSWLGVWLHSFPKNARLPIYRPYVFPRNSQQSPPYDNKHPHQRNTPKFLSHQTINVTVDQIFVATS